MHEDLSFPFCCLQMHIIEYLPAKPDITLLRSFVFVVDPTFSSSYYWLVTAVDPFTVSHKFVLEIRLCYLEGALPNAVSF